MHRERLVVEAWRDRQELPDSPDNPMVSVEPKHSNDAIEQRGLTSLEQRILTLLDNSTSNTDAQREAVDGSGSKDGPFTANGKCYFRIGKAVSEKLIPSESALVEAIWNAPGHTLSLEDAGNALRGGHDRGGITYKSVSGYRDRINRKLKSLPIRVSVNKSPIEHVFFEKIIIEAELRLI